MRYRIIIAAVQIIVMSCAVMAMMFETSWYRFFFLLTCVSGLIVFHLLFNLLNWMDYTVLFVVSYVTFVGFGIIALDWYQLVIAREVFLAIGLGFLTFILGCLIGDIIGRGAKLQIVRKVIVKSRSVSNVFWCALVVYIVGIITMLVFFWRIGAVPILLSDAENDRFTLRAGIASLPILAYCCFLISTLSLQIQARRHWEQIVALGLTGIAIIILIGSGFRAPAMKLLLANFVVFAYLHYARIPIFQLFLVISSIIVFTGVLGFFRRENMLTNDLLIILRLAIFRIFVNNLYVLDLIFDLYPRSEPFMLGRSYLIDLITILPGPQPHFGFWLKDRLGLDFAGGGVTQTIVGEFFLNFGWIGVLIGMFLLGVGLRISYDILSSSEITGDRLILIVIIGIGVLAMVSSGISLVILFEIIPALTVYIFYRVLRTMRIFLRSVSKLSFGYRRIDSA